MKRILFFALAAAGLIAALVAYWAYDKVYAPLEGTADRTILLPRSMELDSLTMLLLRDSVIKDADAFQQVASWKRFRKAREGRYVFSGARTNNSVINKLRSGDQDPVRLTFNSTRTPEELAGRVAAQIAADSADLLAIFHDAERASSFGFNRESFRTMFIPNTYEFWWNTDADAFVERMADEYKRFWTEERKAAAKKIGLSQSEVGILASIVHAETAKRDEAPIVAGLYLNRLRIGMPLQADPTLIYALGDFSIRRVLDEHKEVDSPYNTYDHAGLPPGPINFPDITYLEAVLQPADHDYLYMCAKADFSGYHHFSKSFSQHLRYAREYQRMLSRQGR